MKIDNGQDTLDSRDIQERIDELEEESKPYLFKLEDEIEGGNAGAQEELDKLLTLKEEVKSSESRQTKRLACKS